MSDALVWHLIRDNNSFLHKRGRTARSGSVQFSCEAGNLLNVNTFKYSGLANSKTVDLKFATDDKKRGRVVLTKKNTKKANHPAKASAVTPFTKHTAHCQKSVAATATSKYYRADLASAATSRLNKLKKIVKIHAGLAKGGRSTGRSSSR